MKARTFDGSGPFDLEAAALEWTEKRKGSPGRRSYDGAAYAGGPDRRAHAVAVPVVSLPHALATGNEGRGFLPADATVRFPTAWPAGPRDDRDPAYPITRRWEAPRDPLAADLRAHMASVYWPGGFE